MSTACLDVRALATRRSPAGGLLLELTAEPAWAGELAILMIVSAVESVGLAAIHAPWGVVPVLAGLIGVCRVITLLTSEVREPHVRVDTLTPSSGGEMFIECELATRQKTAKITLIEVGFQSRQSVGESVSVEDYQAEDLTDKGILIDPEPAVICGTIRLPNIPPSQRLPALTASWFLTLHIHVAGGADINRSFGIAGVC